MDIKIKKIQIESKEALKEVQTLTEIEKVRIKYLGKNGEITSVLKNLKILPPDERPKVGQLIHTVLEEFQLELEKKRKEIEEIEKKKKIKEWEIDLTMPGMNFDYGKKHPLTQVLEEIKEIFLRLGFSIAEGPEIELEYYNFESLNFPMDHPARDMQATFYLSKNMVLRTHTSPVQVRIMEKTNVPIRIIVPGKVYRCDADVSHLPMFHQVEGLMVDTKTNFADLKGVLTVFIETLFGKKTKLRFRPSFFPFTEPSTEIDISCVICNGKGCRVCKNTGWLEILGAGMVNPAVFEVVNYDPSSVQGFAFGMGVERIAMLKYGIDDIRIFFQNDLRFLKQF